jgi:hypothetical protein
VLDVAFAEVETVMFAEPSNGTPLIVTGVANFVAVPALPLILPEIVVDTVNPDNVPTLVKLDVTIVELSVVPVNVPAAAVTVIADDPSKFTPLIATGLANFVAVAALPVKT